MELKELTPGYYKIKRLGSYKPIFKRRYPESMFSFLRVVGNGDKRMYHIDHSNGRPSHQMGDFFHEYEIVCKLQSEPSIHRCEIVLSFCDHEGDEFLFTMADVWVLKHLFEELPWLQKPFQFVPRKNKSK
jgi:hypothetical protein